MKIQCHPNKALSLSAENEAEQDQLDRVLSDARGRGMAVTKWQTMEFEEGISFMCRGGIQAASDDEAFLPIPEGFTQQPKQPSGYFEY